MKSKFYSQTNKNKNLTIQNMRDRDRKIIENRAMESIKSKVTINQKEKTLSDKINRL